MTNNKEELVYVPVSNDYMFKKIFCNPKKPQYFASFYESMFGRKVEEIQILENTQMQRSSIDNKMAVLDSLAIINGEYVHIEMQKKVMKGIEKRIEFYPSKILGQVVEAGTSYTEIKKIISIWIFEGRLSKDNKRYVDRIKKIYEKRGEVVLR